MACHGLCQNSTRTAEAEALEATAAAFRGSGEKACCQQSLAYTSYTWPILGFTWLPKAYGNMMQLDATRSARCSSRCWQSSLVFMKMVRIRWKCIRHIFIIFLVFGHLVDQIEIWSLLKSLEVSLSLSCGVCLASPGTAFAHGQRRWGQNWGSWELSGSGNPQQRWKKWAAEFRWMQHI
jgi:hypothetical protein